MILNIPSEHLSEKDKRIINELLERFDNMLSVENDVWKLVDLVWEEIGCDNRNLDLQKINKFYNHPVWIINGLFTENHSLSMRHRMSIANWVLKRNFRRVLDYGGGIGTMASLIAKDNSEISMDIYEPYPSDFAASRIKYYENIRFVDSCDEPYDCVLSLDVLEHVPDPLLILFKIAECIKVDGILIIANCFFPVVKCHLPSSFHLRFSFDFFAKLMGFVKLGQCEGSHACIYQKKRRIVRPKWWKIKAYEKLSRRIFPFFRIISYANRKLMEKVR